MEGLGNIRGFQNSLHFRVQPPQNLNEAEEIWDHCSMPPSRSEEELHEKGKGAQVAEGIVHGWYDHQTYHQGHPQGVCRRENDIQFLLKE